LSVAAAIGSAAGDRYGRASGSTSNRSPDTVAADPVVNCSLQRGTTLQLGIRLVNDGTRPVTLQRIHVDLYGGGLELLATGWAPCDTELSGTPRPYTLAPGANTWVSATVAVRAPCPDGYPLLFMVDYDDGGVTKPFGFNDLGNVLYMGGC
jgi:hypothetical protein